MPFVLNKQKERCVCVWCMFAFGRFNFHFAFALHFDIQFRRVCKYHFHLPKPMIDFSEKCNHAFVWVQFAFGKEINKKQLNLELASDLGMEKLKCNERTCIFIRTQFTETNSTVKEKCILSRATERLSYRFCSSFVAHWNHPEMQLFSHTKRHCQLHFRYTYPARVGLLLLSLWLRAGIVCGLQSMSCIKPFIFNGQFEQ